MNELQIFNNPEFGAVRTMEIEGEAWFVGIDVAKALGYKNPSDAIFRLIDSEDSVKRGVVDNNGKTQQTKLINESGVIALALLSELPSAKKFKRWVTKEVIPSILKTGSYNLPQLSTNELILQMAQANVELEKKITVQEKKITAIEQTVQDIEHTVQESAERLDKTIKTFSSPSYDNWKLDMSLAIAELVKVRNIPEPRLKGFIYAELEQSGVSLQSRLNRLKERMKKQGATYKQRIAITKLDVISNDKKLRPIFEGIVKKYQVTA